MSFFDLLDPSKDAAAFKPVIENAIKNLTISLVEQIIPKVKDAGGQLTIDAITNLSNELTQNIVPALEKAGHSILDGLTITASITISRKPPVP